MKRTCETCAYRIGNDMEKRPVCGCSGYALGDGIFFTAVLIEPDDCDRWKAMTMTDSQTTLRRVISAIEAAERFHGHPIRANSLRSLKSEVRRIFADATMGEMNEASDD